MTNGRWLRHPRLWPNHVHWIRWICTVTVRAWIQPQTLQGRLIPTCRCQWNLPQHIFWRRWMHIMIMQIQQFILLARHLRSRNHWNLPSSDIHWLPSTKFLLDWCKFETTPWLCLITLAAVMVLLLVSIGSILNTALWALMNMRRIMECEDAWKAWYWTTSRGAKFWRRLGIQGLKW